MRILKPGESLRIIRNSAGLGLEALDVTLLTEGSVVEYISPTWVLVRLPDGEELQVHVSALEIIALTKGNDNAT